jgi:pyruvate carboxylase subunit B
MSIPINAPMVGKIISIGVKAGDKVKKNDVVGIMEAMKMHVKIFAPKDGIVKEIHVSPGNQINLNTAIITLE